MRKSTQTQGRLTRKNTRSFGGCSTCRSRRVKCDESKPICTPCSRASLDCKGYEVKIGFVHYVPDENRNKCSWKQDGSHHSRRLLFTEDQRATMSDFIIRIVEDEGADVLLERVEKQSGETTELEAAYQPFGMLRTNVESLKEQSSPESQDSSIEYTIPRRRQDSFFGAIRDLGPILDADISFDLALSPLPSFHDRIFEVDIGGQDLFTWPSSAGISMGSSSFWSMPPISITPPMDPVPASAIYLLSHYKELMGKSFSPLRVRKPPWEVLHYPSAMAALSELSLFNQTSHSKGALLYALLAVSAFHLDKVSTSQAGSTDHWWTAGEGFQNMAKQELQLSLDSELDGMFKAKYKDLLMAILTMVTISVVNGRQSEARSFLLNAELFICARGIPKKTKSRKVKMLHHIFLFLRVIEESTHVYPADWLQNQPVPAIVRCPDMQFPSLRTHSFGIGKDLDDFCGGDFESGLVGQAGTGPDARDSTLFGHIYGIPEKLLSYISQITALANECDVFEMDSSARYGDLRAKIKMLENDISSWKFNDGLEYFDHDESSSDANKSIISHLIRAIHSAILIFFYRRVRWLNPLILQPYVEKTLDHLYAHEHEKIMSSVVNTGIVWPGFIAAVEAADKHLQLRAYTWLRDCANRTGMRNFDVAADFAQELWSYRNEKGDPDIPWTTLVRERQHVLVFT